MKYILITIGLVALAILGKKLYAYQAAQRAGFKNISNEEFKALAGADEEVLILDVRTPQEYQNGNIARSQNIDVLQSNFEAQIADLDASKTVLVYCRSGSRSIKAAQMLCKKGFKNVYNLSNGYLGWKE